MSDDTERKYTFMADVILRTKVQIDATSAEDAEDRIEQMLPVYLQQLIATTPDAPSESAIDPTIAIQVTHREGRAIADSIRGARMEEARNDRAIIRGFVRIPLGEIARMEELRDRAAEALCGELLSDLNVVPVEIVDDMLILEVSGIPLPH